MPRWDDQIGLRFDTIADAYHEVRPRYPRGLRDRLIDVTDFQQGARVLEIGAGSGIATAELVRRGCHVTAVEPGASMAAKITHDLGNTGQVDVVVGRFDEFAWTGEPFDLVIGATSLHWIERSVLEEVLPSLVEPGGYAALLHYLHVAGGDQEFFDATQDCYARWDPDYQEYHLRAPEDSSIRSTALDGLPGFQHAASNHWLVDTPSDRDHYLSLLSTYSTSLSIPEPNRSALLDCIGDLMETRFGGKITKVYRYDLVVTKRCPT